MTISLYSIKRGSRYIGYITSFPRLLSADHMYSTIQIANVFQEAELPDTDLVHSIIKQVPGGPTEPKVILEGSQSGVKLSFATNRKSPLFTPGWRRG